MSTELTGARRVIWIGGLIVSFMFILIMFVFLVLAILDSDYQQIGSYIIFAAYGILHLVINGAFKTNRKWGKPGLLTLYSLWAALALYSALFGVASKEDGMALLTAVVVALGSALMITLLLQTKPSASRQRRQTA